MEKEIWKQIPGFSRYEASNLGNIRTHDWKGSGRTAVLKPAKSKKGYLTTVLIDDEGNNKSIKVHRMVAFAFLGLPNYMSLTVNHKNHIKDDNRPENLEYMTALDNAKEAQDNGLQVVLKGERNGFSKLTEKEVLEIREKFIPFKYPKKQLALEYGVSVGAIKNILLRRTWSWL